MDPKPDVIRRQIDETRESLTEKLETLEGQVKQTVANVTEAVEHTVDSVKSTVGETVDAVKRTFDIPYQVQRHPYALTGGALLAGAALGYLVGRRRAEYAVRRPAFRPAPQPMYRPEGYRPEGFHRPEGTDGSAPRHPSEPGFLARLAEPLVGEFDKIKATAVAAALGMVRDVIKRSVPPSLAERVEEIMNDMTRRAGGEPVAGPVLPRAGGPGSSDTHL